MKLGVKVALFTTCGVIGIGFGAWMIVRHHQSPIEPTKDVTETSETQPSEESKPVATVKAVRARMGEISASITAYGNVTAEQGEVAVYSIPFECRVRHLRVIGGQQVQKGSTLVEVEPSADAKLQFAEARNALDAANKDLKQVHQRFEMKLATNQDLFLSQQTAQVAQIRLENWLERGAAEKQQTITAEGAGLINKIAVQEGQIVLAGAPLLELVSRDKIEVKLGIEQSEVTRLHENQPVQIFAIGGGSASDGIPGKVRLITQRVNPDTRLVDVLVTPESHDALLLDGFVRVVLQAETKQALIVPRDAVLPGEQDYELFTVKDGHAVKCPVKLGLQNDREVEVIGEQLKVGDLVVTLGNYELEDGMAVSGENLR